MRTILGVIIGISLIGCTNETIDQNDLSTAIIEAEVAEEKPVNLFLGCWEERIDSSLIYWCFDSNSVNRDGYIYPYTFESDSIQIAAIQYLFSFAENKTELINLNDGSKIELNKSELTESPDVF